MAQAAAGDKTEKPTPKKRHDSRKKGMAARSSELPQAVSLVVAALMLPALIPGLISRMGGIWQTAISPEAIVDPNVAVTVFGQLFWEATRVFIPMVAMIAGASVVAQLALSGGLPNPHKLKPQWKNLNPKNGVKRLVSVQVLWDFGRTLSKLLLLIGVSWGLYSRVGDRVLGGARPLADTLGGIGSIMKDLFIRMAAAAILVGVLDALFNKKRFTKQLRMTKQELKEELKQQESSPQVKAEIRRRQVQLSRNRMIAAVASADVVITNPTHLAIALGYDPDEGAPRVLAKGAGRIAERIREEAKTHGVPIREDKPLARSMFHSIEVGDLLPAEFFAAVAAILASVFRAKRRRTA